jgi:hypothetical protein
VPNAVPSEVPRDEGEEGKAKEKSENAVPGPIVVGIGCGPRVVEKGAGENVSGTLDGRFSCGEADAPRAAIFRA